MCRPWHCNPTNNSTMGAERLLMNPSSRGDSSTISTQSTHESSLSTQLHENRHHGQYFTTITDQESSPLASQLFVHHLDHNVESSIWPPKFVATMYITVAVALAFRNPRILYAIAVMFVFEVFNVILKWRRFLIRDFRARMMARSHSTSRPNLRLWCLLSLVLTTGAVVDEMIPERKRRVVTDE
jgi:hypothetical protein